MWYFTSNEALAKLLAEIEKETASFQTGFFVFFRAVVFFFLSRFPPPVR